MLFDTLKLVIIISIINADKNKKPTNILKSTFIFCK